MNVRKKILIILFLGCALLAQSAIAATIVAASDASATSKASAQYVCDGSSDQTEINDALARGGEVILTEGTFRTSGTVFCKSGNTLTGKGQDKTIISMAGDYAARIDIAQPNVKVQDLTITQRGWLMITTSHVTVEDVTIRDSKKTAPTVNGMFFVWADGRVCEDIAFTRCIAQDVGSTGFNLNGQKSPRENRNIRFEGCKAIRCGNEGSGKIWAVGFDFHEGADLYDLTVNNCYAEDCWESGFYFEPNFYNGEDPNQAIPVQVNSKVTNCVAVNNGWRNNLDTAFYKTGFYLSSAVTLTGCDSKNNKNNGFWVWQSAKDVILNSCTDDGSDKAFQVRTGSNLKFNDCTSWNARTYALYAWGTSGAIFDNFRIINPKKTSGAVCLGLREDHPNDPWAVTGCTFDILLTGANKDTLIRYDNAYNNKITINGIGPVTHHADPDTHADRLGFNLANDNARCRQGRDPRHDRGRGLQRRRRGRGLPRRRGRELWRRLQAKRGRRHRVQRRGRQPRRRLDAVVGVAQVHGERHEGRHLRRRVQGGVAELGYLLQARRGRDGRGNGLGPEHGQLRYVRRGQEAGHPDRRRARPADLDQREPQPLLHEVHRHGTQTPTTPPTTPTFAGAAIPGLIQAENYNTGGEGVAYHDTTSARTKAAPTARPRASTSSWRAARAATWSAGSGPASGSSTR